MANMAKNLAHESSGNVVIENFLNWNYNGANVPTERLDKADLLQPMGSIPLSVV